ncbi:hypothetical protein [Amedibacillus sp. YH-ame10]
MVRVYRAVAYLKKPNIRKTGRDLRNDKINEALQCIQERGGVILNCIPISDADLLFDFFVMYEDNRRFEEINSYLRDVVFDFDKYIS